GSAVVQLGIRDSWIGWSRERFLRRLQDSPTSEWARWIADRLRDQFEAVYAVDFTEQGLISPAEFDAPTPEVIARLRELAGTAREKHRLHASAREHKSADADEIVDWEERARTHLYVAKRAGTLADLLEDRLRL